MKPSKQIAEAWAKLCRKLSTSADLIGLKKPQAYRDGWHIRLLEQELQYAMQRAIPEIPKEEPGVALVNVEWDYLDAVVTVAYDPETHCIGSVYANGIDIGLLVSQLPRASQMAIADLCAVELDACAADESHCAAMDRAEERSAA